MLFAFDQYGAFALEDDDVVVAAAPVLEPDNAGIVTIGAGRGFEHLSEGLDGVAVVQGSAESQGRATEFGYDLNSCGRDLGACSQQEQASKLTAAYDVFTADPHIAGIWWYQSHDDSTGHFGLMNNDNSTRPSFTALSKIARAEDG